MGLWQTLHSLDQDQKKRFLSFCTGSDRVPIKVRLSWAGNVREGRADAVVFSLCASVSVVGV